MSKPDRKVLVVARKGADLAELFEVNGYVEATCGNAFRIIARSVLEGGGKALVPASLIRMAIDTNDGVNLILDNFDLLDERTQAPLLHLLLKNF